jgi:hypothetical protein
VTKHRLMSESGHVVEFIVDEAGRITEMLGDWPEGVAELVFTEGVPAHQNVANVPEHVRAFGPSRGPVDVCYYDPDRCRTCFCDDSGRMWCVGKC